MRLILLLGLLSLAACAARMAPSMPPDDPDWAIAPAALPALQLSQQLRFEPDAGRGTLEALLEIDANEVRLAAFAAQQPAFRLRWNGESLETTRADWLPPSFRPRWVLDDLLLLLAPLESLQATVPSGWQLDQHGTRRELRRGGVLIAAAERITGGWTVERPERGYRLRIENADADEPR